MEVLHFVLILSVSVTVSYARCNFPPSVWCSSKEIARSCQVSRQCEKWSMPVKVAPPVNLTLYYESLCPDCKHFITEMLYPTYQRVGLITSLMLVPYGNARETREGNQWKFQCQHGEQECLGNMIATCVINLMHFDIPRVFGFINCMEKSLEHPLHAAEKCAKIFTNIPLPSVFTCVNSTKGNEWEHQMALKTQALQPPHKYVPWITLNGVHTEDIQKQAENDLQKLICDTYTGPKPAACHKHKLHWTMSEIE